MPNTPRSSFIPKESSALPSTVRRRKSFSVFNFIASTILVLSVLLAGGVFLYEKNRQDTLTARKSDLAAAKGQFNEEKIAEIRAFDRQVRAATFLLENHVAPSKVFAELEQHTKTQLQVSDLSFEYNPGLEIFVTMNGVAREFNTVAHQSTEFREHPLFQSSVFSGFSIVDEGPQEGASIPTGDDVVSFTVAGSIPLEELRFTGVTESTANTVSDNSISTQDEVVNNI